MPVSEHKELGANTIVRHSSDFHMGVPIKKRRFPFIRPSSPPPQIPSTAEEPVFQANEEPNLKQANEEPTLKQDLSSSTAGRPLKEAFRSPGSICDSPQVENGERHGNGNTESVENIDSPSAGGSPTKVSGSAGSISSLSQVENGEHSGNGNIGLVKNNESTELQMPPNTARVQEVDEGLRDEGEHLKNINSVHMESLVSAEHTFSDLSLQASEGICEEEKLDPCSWNLALTEKQSGSLSNYSTDTNLESRNSQTNRTHWDLNTMMDTWDGSTNHSAIVHRQCVEENRDSKSVIQPKKTILAESEDSLVLSGAKTLNQCENTSMLSTLSASQGPETRNDILLHLSLSTSSGLQTTLNPEPLHTSLPKTDSRSGLSSKLELSRNMSHRVSNLSLAGSRSVKSEPSDESKKQDCQGVKASPSKLAMSRIVKTEPWVSHLPENQRSSDIRSLKLSTPGSVKLEPFCGVNQGIPKMVVEKPRDAESEPCNAALPVSRHALPLSDVPSCTMTLPNTLDSSSCLPSLGLSNYTDTSNEVPPITTPMHSTVTIARFPAQTDGAIEMVADFTHNGLKKSEVADDMSGLQRVGAAVAGSISSSINTTNKLQRDSQGNNDVAESDDEKINLFDDMQDDCSSGTDDESEANHGVEGVVSIEDKCIGEAEGEDDDYEDGEVREPLVNIAAEGCVRLEEEVELAYHGTSHSIEVNFSGCPDGKVSTPAHAEDRDVQLDDPGLASISYGSVKFDDIQLSRKHDSIGSEPACLQEASLAEMLTKPLNVAHRGLLNGSRNEDSLDGCTRDLFSFGTVSASRGISSGNDQGSTLSQQENVEGNKPGEPKFSLWSKTDSAFIGTEVTKDVNCKGNQSRIINLARAINGSSPGRVRSFPGRYIPSRIERGRFSDGVRDGDKLYTRGSRDDGSTDGRNKFDRQRNHEQLVGSAGSDFVHGRGRPDKRFDSSHAAVMVARDCTVVGAGRKPLRDEIPNFRHPPTRRRSPGGRGRPVQIVRRSARDISPDRCIDRGDPNSIGLRPEKKFMRGMPDDMMDTVFSRSQPQFQQVEDHFVRGRRSFSPVQRKGPLHIPRIRSRSPSRTRSPGPWSSPRRRSPDGFGRSELIHRRSPPIYRIRRIRSPHQRPVFSDDVEGRRHGSPPYISRISNDMREAEHPRSFIPNRSPSGRVLSRGGIRRFDTMDPRERVDNEEYFSGAIHSDRFHEIGGDEGRRIRRPFRQAYDPTEVEKFHFHIEGGPRPYRFAPEDDAEFHERGNREFERRVKNRSGNAPPPRRTRSVEEHEENFRHNDQGWDGSSFEDVSPAKRRRFER